jgi:protein-S-isoprenylcysteine O-methyltransferase Ste14
MKINQQALERKAMFAVIVEVTVLAVLLFVPAGTVLWLAGWVFLVLFCGFSLLEARMLGKHVPELLAERMSFPIQRGQPLWDKVLMSVFVPVFGVWLILMPLDAVRFAWSTVPVWLQVLGAVGVMLALSIWYITFRENTYLYPVVKVDQGQRVVTTGPYRYVRHPLYASCLILFPAIALLLGSWWGLLLSLFFIGVFVLRTVLEDRLLRNELAGYTEYARKVKYRLIPHVWSL